MKRHLTKFIFLFTLIIGFSITVSAQDDDKKKDKPPRREPPKIVVPKNPPPPKNNDKDKKKPPEGYSEFIFVVPRSDLS